MLSGMILSQKQLVLKETLQWLVHVGECDYCLTAPLINTR